MYDKREHIVGACSCENWNGGVSQSITYSCPCGKGSIVEEHIGGTEDPRHSVDFICEECEKKYDIDLSDGTYLWFLKEKQDGR